MISPSSPPPTSHPRKSNGLKSALWLGVALLSAAVIWRFAFPAASPPPPSRAETAAVTLAGPYLIAVQPGSLLEKKLEFSTVREERLTTPLLTVTGAVMARLRAGSGPMEDRWQFSSVELSGIYADWQKTGTEMEFAAKQLAKTRELTAAQFNSQSRVVERLRKLVATGTEAVRDLTSAEASLLQTQLEGQKAVFEAESALTQATHSHADLERHLLQAGVDPALLTQAPAGAALVMADVPEVRIGLVKEGQACEARFYGLPQHLFRGVVRSLAPALSPERRTLRVFFELNDQEDRLTNSPGANLDRTAGRAAKDSRDGVLTNSPGANLDSRQAGPEGTNSKEGVLKPGMYAEIGLGTDPRQAILAPADGVLHIGEGDYVLTEAGPGLWRVTEIQVGERAGERVEILGGLSGGERLVGNGAILLKPLVVQALLKARETPAATAGEAQR